MSSHASDQLQPTIPGLLRLPLELRARILLDVLSSGVCRWVPRYTMGTPGFPLHKETHVALQFPVQHTGPINEPQAPIHPVLFSCKLLHYDCLQLLAENFTFVVHIDVRPDAPTGANAFCELQALNPMFRDRIRKVALVVTFLCEIGSFNLHEVFATTFNPKKDPLMFEKMVENVKEVMDLMPGVGKAHLAWNIWFGNGGLDQVHQSYTRLLWGRLRKEMPGRVVDWTGQGCMGCFDEEATV